MVLRNLKTPIVVYSSPVAAPINGTNSTGLIPPIIRPDGGLGMVIGILRIPACL